MSIEKSRLQNSVETCLYIHILVSRIISELLQSLTSGYLWVVGLRVYAFFLIKKKKKFVYLFIFERQREWRRGREPGQDPKRSRLQDDSTELDARIELTNFEIMT